jgi:L-serine kinase (ATP) / ParB family transcriptional regulator, heme-responsive regulator
MVPELPELKIVEVSAILFHEKHDQQRTLPLIERIRHNGFFRNPPIVAPLKDIRDQYIVLDGANRITALQEMGFPHILVQVVESNHPGLNLENWNHVVWDMPVEEFLTRLHEIPDSSLDLIDEDKYVDPDLWGDSGLAVVQIPDGSMYSLSAKPKGLEPRVELLHAIVDCYKDCCNLDRTSVRMIASLLNLYPTLTGLVIFPQFKLEDVLNLAGAICLLPTGITRFTISPRALHINYPLFELAADKPLKIKNRDLHTWIQRKLAGKGVRYYAEATFHYDE